MGGLAGVLESDGMPQRCRLSPGGPLGRAGTLGRHIVDLQVLKGREICVDALIDAGGREVCDEPPFAHVVG